MADPGNNRVQKFNSETWEPKGATPESFNLNQPKAVSIASHPYEKRFYIADTGNNRVLLAKIPQIEPGPVWNAMNEQLVAGDIEGAINHFSTDSADDYRDAFLEIGINKLNADINAIGALTPVFIKKDTAQYYFERTIEGELLLFPVDFVKENGMWKILGF